MSGDLLIERRACVLWVTINREPRRNSLNAEIAGAIGNAVTGAQNDRSVRAIVLTGAGEKAFCAGADLAANTNGFAFAVDYSRPQHYVVELFKVLQECTLPVIARVNGHAVAGGFGLLCACDMAIAADDILVGTTESRVGITPMMILPYLMRVLPPRRVHEMCMSGEMFSAAQALEWGALNYVTTRVELDTKVEWLLGRIVDKSPTAIRLGKQAYRTMRDMGVHESLEYAQVMVPVMASTQDAKEGLMAFREKRAPQWTGR